MSDYKMFRGDAKVITVTVTNKDGTPRDLTGAKLTLTCKVDPADDAFVFQRSVTNVSSPLLGVANLTINPVDTASITQYSVYVFDVELDEGSGQITTVDYGKLSISVDVTT